MRPWVLSGLLAIALLAGPADAAEAARCQGAITQHRGFVTLTAENVHVVGGLSCGKGRSMIRRYFAKKLRDFAGCAVPATNGLTCRLGVFSCATRQVARRLVGRCVSPTTRAVRFLETDLRYDATVSRWRSRPPSPPLERTDRRR